MRKKYICIIVAALFGFISCNKSESDINEEYSNGVVLVQNMGYYEVKISDELSAYFTDYSEEEGFSNLSFDKDSIVAVTSFGTGFLYPTKEK